MVSPLQSLMEDLCNRMKETGISSIALLYENSEDDGILKDVREGVYSLVYASPECLLGKKAWRRILCSDEFRDHCIGVAYDEIPFTLSADIWRMVCDSKRQLKYRVNRPKFARAGY